MACFCVKALQVYTRLKGRYCSAGDMVAETKEPLLLMNSIVQIMCNGLFNVYIYYQQ